MGRAHEPSADAIRCTDQRASKTSSSSRIFTVAGGGRTIYGSLSWFVSAR